MAAEQTAALEGVVPVVPTPFRADESIDLEGVASCVRFAARCGVKAVCLPAYASEFYKLSDAERLDVVEAAVGAAGGKVQVVAQSNHPSARVAADLARRHQDMGAGLVSFAVPRQFAVPQGDLLGYCRAVCDAVTVPVLLQDFNPGGPTVGADFVRTLKESCPNFRYVKLEEPLLSPKVRAIREAVGGGVGVLAGWGGMYLPELIPSGVCGLMPGLGAADLLQLVWRLGKEGRADEALGVFERVLPQLVFSLQSLELFLWMEKQLLAGRRVIDRGSAHARRPAWTPDEDVSGHGLRLNARLLRACRDLGLV
jgi:4-hydroxy-tetrahydrodipicolinate synthase